MGIDRQAVWWYCLCVVSEQERLRRKARGAVREARLQGKLVSKPCEVCGDTLTEAHHDDYHAPLTIRWLCHRHHGSVHAGAGYTRLRPRLDARNRKLAKDALPRALILLRHKEMGMSVVQIAQAYNLSRQRVYVLLRKAKENISA